MPANSGHRAVRRIGAPPRTMLQSKNPARETEAAWLPAARFRSFRPSLLRASTIAVDTVPVESVDHTADLGQLVGRYRTGAKCSQNELPRRSAEGALHKVTSDPLLHLLARCGRFIHVIAEALSAPQQPSERHQPHLRERGVVIAVFAEFRVNLPDS